MSSKLEILFILTPIIVLLIVGAVFLFLYRRYLEKQLLLCIEDNLYIKKFRQKYSLKKLAIFSSTVEKIASRLDNSLVEKIGLDKIWIEKLDRYPTRKREKRVLRFCVKNGLYSAFLAVLKKPKINDLFLNYCQEQKSEAVLNGTAKKSYLDFFDGKAAAQLFLPYIEKIAEMSQVSSPEDRWFSFRILSHIDDNASFGDLKWNAFCDHDYEIRKMIIENIEYSDRVNYYNYLYDRLLNDTQQEIRVKVKKIIVEQFVDLYKPDFSKLNVWQQKHFTDVLSKEMECDKKIAFNLVLEDNIELRQQAVDFLNKTGSLKKLFLSLDDNDTTKLQYAYKMLKSALEVHSEEFLSSLQYSTNQGTLLCGALLLKELGWKGRIKDLAIAVFNLRKRGVFDPLHSDLYQKTLECINLRGEDSSFIELKKEMLDNRNNEELMALLLDMIPPRAEVVFRDYFIAAINDENFSPRENLLNSILRVSSDVITSEFIRIIKSNEGVAWSVRLNAIEYFKKANIELCFQYILENLDLYHQSEIGGVFQRLYSYSPKGFKETVSEILSIEDSRTSITILENLYTLNESSFVSFIKTALENSDAKIRNAAIKGLFLFNTADFFSEVTPLLSDSDKEVRLTAARLIAQSASGSQVKEIRAMILDEHELPIVKKALIVGLGNSCAKESVELLVEVGGTFLSYFDLVLESLQNKDIRKIAKQLVQIYTFTTELGQRIIYTYFKNEGMLNESYLLELLKESKGEDAVSIRNILYKSTYIEKLINRLRNKSAQVRLASLQKLIEIDTVDAYKGVLLSVRDTSKNVCTVALDAIKKVKADQPKVIEALKNDSSRVVQNNILWAIKKIEKREKNK